MEDLPAPVTYIVLWLKRRQAKKPLPTFLEVEAVYPGSLDAALDLGFVERKEGGFYSLTKEGQGFADMNYQEAHERGML